jgi:hypothetical protein
MRWIRAFRNTDPIHPQITQIQLNNLRNLWILFRDSFELDKPAQLRDHHSLFAFHPARECRPVTQLILSPQVIPDLAVCTLTVPAEIPVRDSINGEVLETAQQAVLLGNGHFVSHYLEIDELLVGIEQIRRARVDASAPCALFTHRQRQYNRNLLKFVH